MDKHTKKMIAPVVITLLFVLYTSGCGVFLRAVDGFSPALLLLAIPFVILGAGMVCVLFARIREIRSGEEDDLDNY